MPPPNPQPGPCVSEGRKRLHDEIVGASAAHQRMVAQLERIAATEAPALIEGETGSGKELAARVIHYGGLRSARPFVPVNCGALPEMLIESELFGHERGAFTDARQARAGLVAEANGGTLFLDEVDALSGKAQVTLLRFLQDQRYRPLGTARELSTDVRVVAASNRPLAALVAQGAFRADLMYRLKILHLVLPPLRERVGDIDLLATHFIRRFSAKYGLPARTLSTQELQWLRSQPWPGNIRELENWVHREFLMGGGIPLRQEEPPRPEPAMTEDWDDSGLMRFQLAKAEAVRLFEQDYLQRALRQAEGNVTRAAQMVGKERRAFGKLLKKHGIERDAA
ncbi:sigma-54 dependent transcriptional regulator [Variovorax sp. J31P216]|uniref:sigma 54-interacting transcriptional regulator n=1 Tax=Variovorax saccharolyticus TaxID=3053516 RepID=UPI002578D228|nr:sigma-54 dependent transcriptional regulator [Variovorax sp. J31P216]MDM0030325.1 sigma-54 dependent transcriptional regulator [Variovorax sp. J31P216]